MLKIYFKKLLATLIGTVIFSVFFGLEYLVITKFFFSIEGKLVIQYAMILTSLIFALFIILVLRIKSKQKKEEYLNQQKENTYSLKKDLWVILKSKDFIAEILVLLTICLPMFIITGINSDTPILPFVFAAAVLTALSLLLLFIFDVPIWLITHSKWNKD